MSAIFDTEDYALALSTRRSIPSHAAELYAAHIVGGLRRDPLRVLDVGCGTGRFFFAFASKLADLRLDYLGIDTSASMVDRLAKSGFPENVPSKRTALTPLEQVTGEFDVVLMSEMIHLLDRPQDAIAAAAARLAPGGRIAIRTTQLGDLLTRDWYKYFPECLTIDLARHKSQELINTSLRQAGLMVVGPTRIDESTVVTADEYVQAHQTRPYSTLREISAEKFDAGIVAMRSELEGRTRVVRGMLMTLTIGERGDDQAG